MKERKMSTKTLVMGAILTALVVILQFMGAFIRFGTFSISLVLLPIVIGAATCGSFVAGWLGLVFGVVVLASGDAAPFLAVDPLGTVVTVLLKGVLSGLLAGACYKQAAKVNTYFATAVAAVVCPVVNTGVFLLGCLAFFMEPVAVWATEAGLGDNVGKFMILVLVGGNFLFELLVNIVLTPAVVRLLNIRKKS